MTRLPFAHQRVFASALIAILTLGAAIRDLAAAELRLSELNHFTFRPKNGSDTQTLFFDLCLLPEEDVGSATESEGYQIVREDSAHKLNLQIECKYEGVGLVTLGPFSLRVNGQDLQTPSFKVVVLPVLAHGSGLTFTSTVDPNGSGKVSLEIESRQFFKGRQSQDLVEIDAEKLPPGIKRLDHSSSWADFFATHRDVFLNTTGADFTLLPEHFKNLPEGYELPRLVIPPTPKETASNAAE